VEDIPTPVMHRVALELTVLIDNDEAQLDRQLPVTHTIAQEIVVPIDNVEEHLDRQPGVTSPVRSSATFSMSLQNVTDEIVRPQIIVNEVQPLLTLVSDFPNIHNIIADLNASVVPVLQKEMHSMKDLLLNSARTFVHDDLEVRIVKDQHIQPVQISSTLRQHQEVHNNKNIQHDLKLWARIQEYDQRTADEGFTQVPPLLVYIFSFFNKILEFGGVRQRFLGCRCFLLMYVLIPYLAKKKYTFFFVGIYIYK